MELDCLLIKIIATAFNRSLDAVYNCFGRKGKIIRFVHKMFLNEFSHYMSLYILFG